MRLRERAKTEIAKEKRGGKGGCGTVKKEEKGSKNPTSPFKTNNIVSRLKHFMGEHRLDAI